MLVVSGRYDDAVVLLRKAVLEETDFVKSCADIDKCLDIVCVRIFRDTRVVNRFVPGNQALF